VAIVLTKSFCFFLIRKKKVIFQARALLQTITYVGKEYSDSCYTDKLNARMGYDEASNSVSVADGVQAKLYPNPNNGIFTLSYNLAKDVTAADVMIIDVTGKLIYQDKLDIENHNINLKLQNAQNGIYFVKIMSGKVMISVNKVIINN